ncbi:hypothetical protein OIE66_34945 [Nonomuraea sp. NBC_01738]|uniref:hypothetical protein n=1 Tax=Nonomuraea sp. NBC_01738 TaxID=2976003 RepID=UPI002E1579D5|nr:hypothetical protein OIE66_34945 [Nonomuraea sp. NBC_01738]
MADGYEAIPPDLRKAMQACTSQIPVLAQYRAAFSPAHLSPADFSLAPQAHEVGSAYCKGTAENGFQDKRYESVVQYIDDLVDALEHIGANLSASAANYSTAAQASGVEARR